MRLRTTSRPMPERPRTINRIAAGAASGAMGTVALNVATYADIAIRGRAPSTVPEGTVQAMADTVGADLAGDGGKRAAEHRRTASAPCSVTVPALPSARSMERCDLRSHSSASRSPDSLSASVAMMNKAQLERAVGR